LLTKILPFNTIYPFLKRRLTSVLYHTVGEEPSPFVKNLYRHRDIKTFKSDVEFFLKKFNFVSFQNILDYFEKGTELPTYPIYLSFDDGHREMEEIVAPILYNMGVPASYFLIVNSLDNKGIIFPHKKSYIIEQLKNLNKSKQSVIRKALEKRYKNKLDKIIDYVFKLHPYQNRDEIEQLAELLMIDWKVVLNKFKIYLNSIQTKKLIRQGFHVGSHGLDHTKFVFLTKKEREINIRESMDFFRDNFQLTQIGFSFPNSHYKVDREWMSSMIKRDSRVRLFFSTGKYSPNKFPLINRIGFEEKCVEGLNFALEPPENKIKVAFFSKNTFVRNG
jgi:peptidoglycan/xylan/chitin deacetylase (PgdA/CDA1 family)